MGNRLSSWDSVAMYTQLSLPVLVRIALLAGVASCSDQATDPGRRPSQAQLQILSGDNQAQVAGRTLPQPLEVRVIAGDGRPLGGETVVFATFTGGSFAGSGEVVSDAQGRASVVWILGAVAGEQRARVTLSSGASPRTFHATALPDIPTQLQLLIPDSAATLPASRITYRLSARVLDRHSNGVPGVIVRWLSPALGTIDADSTLSDKDGKVFATWTILSPTGDSAPLGEYLVTMRIDDERAHDAVPRTIRRWIANMTTREALSGLWTADRWEFFEDSSRTRLVEDVMAHGMSGTLNIVGAVVGGLKWYWREEYRWWGPNIGTDIWGELFLDGLLVLATPTGGASALECDWGDCDGPLHGRYDIVLDGTQLIITGRQAAAYRGGFEPVPTWTRLTLSRQ